MATPARRKFPLDRGYRREADYPENFDRASEDENACFGRFGGEDCSSVENSEMSDDAILASPSHRLKSAVFAVNGQSSRGGVATHWRDRPSGRVSDNVSRLRHVCGERDHSNRPYDWPRDPARSVVTPYRHKDRLRASKVSADFHSEFQRKRSR